MSAGSIRGRLLAGTALWLAAALLAGGFGLSWAFRRSVDAAFVDRLDSLLLAVVAALHVPPAGPPQLARDVPFPEFDRVYSGWYWQVSDGDARLASRSLWDADLAGAVADLAGPRATGVVEGPRDQTLRVVARRLRYPSRAEPITVLVAGPRQELQRQIAAFDRLLAIALGLLAATLVAAVAVQVGYGLRPFRRLAGELDEIRSGRRARLSVGHPREIEPLAQAMNAVLDQDARRVERARALAGNLAHGLKTPLSVLGVEAGRPEPDRTRIAAQASRMAAVIDHHLARAAAAGAQATIGTSTAIRPVVLELRAMLLRIHAERRLAIDVDVPEHLAFAGESQDLEEMLGNLADNACKWARARVTIRAARGDRGVEIAVEDDGPGLPAEQAGTAVQRGVRLDPHEPGTGLGLAITADLAGLYGGSLDLGRSAAGGLRTTLHLPLAPCGPPP